MQVGFCYDGLFRGLHSISAGRHTTKLSPQYESNEARECLPTTLHPAMIRSMFPLLLCFNPRPNEELDRLSSYVYRRNCHPVKRANLQVKASGSCVRQGWLSGSLTANITGGLHVHEGLKSTLLTQEDSRSGLRLFSQIEWSGQRFHATGELF